MPKPSDSNLPPSPRPINVNLNCTVEITVEETVQIPAPGYGFGTVTREVVKTVTYQEAVTVYNAIGLADVPVNCRDAWWDIELIKSGGTSTTIETDCTINITVEQTVPAPGFGVVTLPVPKTVTYEEAVTVYSAIGLEEVPVGKRLS